MNNLMQPALELDATKTKTIVRDLPYISTINIPVLGQTLSFGTLQVVLQTLQQIPKINYIETPDTRASDEHHFQSAPQSRTCLREDVMADSWVQ